MNDTKKIGPSGPQGPTGPTGQRLDVVTGPTGPTGPSASMVQAAWQLRMELRGTGDGPGVVAPTTIDVIAVTLIDIRMQLREIGQVLRTLDK